MSSAHPSRLTVGVSFSATPDAQALSSDIHQNVAFLLMCLRAIPNVGRVALINGGSSDQLPPTLEFGALQVPLVQPQDVTHDVDVVIEMSAKLPQAWIRRVKARGVKVIAFLVGHAYTSMIEPVIFERDQAIGLVNMEPDEVWLMHKDWHTAAPILRTLLRAPVVKVPHLWAPDFLLRQVQSLEAAGHRWGFDASERARSVDGWGAAIFEPNIGVVKASAVPMLVCEAAYREQPPMLRHMMVMNTVHMKEHPTFNHFAQVLDLTRDNRASYEPRVTVPECLSRFGRDVVVSHHWESEQNHLFCDVLHGGYPLVHNSRWLADRAPGFFYPGFQASEGGRALVRAWQQPADFWTDYRRQAQTFLASLHPEHGDNVRAFMARLTGSRTSAAEVSA